MRRPDWQTLLAAVMFFRAMAPTRTAPAARGITPLGPPFSVGQGPTSAAWREEAITRANELEGLALWIVNRRDGNGPSDADVLEYVQGHLNAVRKTAANDDHALGWWGRRMSAWRGAAHERTLGNLDAVEATLLRLAPASYLSGELPSLHAHVNRFLGKSDPRRARAEQVMIDAKGRDVTDAERGAVVAALHAANTQRRRDLLRVRSFRNVMFIAAGLLVPIAIGLAIFGFVRPDAIPLCFNPVEKAKVVCPTEEVPIPSEESGAQQQTAASPPGDIDPFIDRAAKGGDIALIEVIGLIAAIVASVVGLRNVKGTSTPYSLAVALALIKIPLGALAAVLGLVLMAGGFVPGLSALDTSAQILAWALVFGFSQQLLTRLVDQRASTLLDNVGGKGAAGDRAKS